MKDQLLNVEFESDPRCFDSVETNENEKKTSITRPKDQNLTESPRQSMKCKFKLKVRDGKNNRTISQGK